jgi:hypothetical protein
MAQLSTKWYSAAGRLHRTGIPMTVWLRNDLRWHRISGLSIPCCGLASHDQLKWPVKAFEVVDAFLIAAKVSRGANRAWEESAAVVPSASGGVAVLWSMLCSKRRLEQ